MSTSISRTGGRNDFRQLLSVPTLILAAVLFAIYVVFDLRAGGRNTSIWTTKLMTLGGYLEEHGPVIFTSMILLNALLALTSAILMVQSYRMLKARREGAAAGACSSSTGLLMGFLFVACPSCPVPLLGTLGITFVASSMPLYGLEFKLLALALVVGFLVWVRRKQAGLAASRQAAPAT